MFYLSLFCEIWQFIDQKLLTIPYDSIWLGKIWLHMIEHDSVRFLPIPFDANRKQ